MEAGIKDMAFVTGRNKRAIEDHFDINYELEDKISDSDKESLLKDTSQIIKECSFVYKRQIEIYQWLFRKNCFKVSDIGYIIYANGKSDEKEYNKNLSFEEYLFPLACNTDWVDEIIKEIYQCLNSEKLPKSGGGWNGEGCEQCLYKKKLFDIFKAHTSN